MSSRRRSVPTGKVESATRRSIGAIILAILFHVALSATRASGDDGPSPSPRSCFLPEGGRATPLCVRRDGFAYLTAASAAAVRGGVAPPPPPGGPSATSERGPPERSGGGGWRDGADGTHPRKSGTFASEADRTSPSPSPSPSPPDASHECAVYLAESSIPNAGLGVYTAIEVPPFETVGSPEIALLLVDIRFHADVEATALHNYMWGTRAAVEDGNFEAESVSFLSPGVGTAMNAHAGMTAVRVAGSSPEERRRRPGAMDRTRDPGAGAVSDVGEALVRADRTAGGGGLPAGSELFTRYGEPWFEERGYDDVPVEDDYQYADEVVRNFARRGHTIGARDIASEREEAWEGVLKNVASARPRARAALPDDVGGVPHALRVGTARHSLPNSVRSDAWLKANGHCMDNLHGGPSTIPQAGRGAFAARFLSEGSVIAMSPLITISRSDLVMYDRRKDPDGTIHRGDTVVGHQLLLNYCFGNTKSSLVMFPYSAGVPFINHGGEKANAKIRWSTSKYNNLSWLEEDMDSILSRKKVGLMMDVVAIRNITVGEEVLIDYGSDWERAWEEHVAKWKPEVEHWVTSFAMNEDAFSVVRTVAEQAKEPYPANIRTVCHYEYSSGLGGNGSVANEVRWRMEKYGIFEDNWRPCDVLSRQRVRSGSDAYRYVYIARMHNYQQIRPELMIPQLPHVVTMIPRWAIKFSDRPYQGNQHLKNAFRHSIGFPDGMYPQAWLDLS